MGWSGGSGLLGDCWKQVRKFVPEKDRTKLLAKLIELFENEDCDTMDEIENLFPEAKKALILAGHEPYEEEE